jgi:hypothetical protein
MHRQLITIALVASVVFAAYTPPSDDDIKKMKINQLKEFLRDRNVECKGCVEKSDFVKKCLEVKHLDLTPERAARKIPTEPLEKVWGKAAGELCAKHGASEEQCKQLIKVVELSCDEYRRKFKRELGTGERELLGLSLQVPYKDYGERLIVTTVKDMVKGKVTGSAKIRDLFHKRFVPWLRDTALNNPNEMYEDIKKANKAGKKDSLV